MIARWLKLKEAVKYSNIGKDRLKRLALSGVIRGAPDPDSRRGDWIFDRLSIDAYRESQMTAPSIQEKAIAILKGYRL